MKTIMALWTSFVMLFVSFVPGFVPPDKPAVETTYPYIFVHGLFGWGQDEGIDKDISYWGATSCYLMQELNSRGFECYDASVGPMSSNWDRACELYAQLTGTRVDYGAAHSAEHNHLRYGRTYEEPMVDGWGEKNENGGVKKINLIGHSFGGNTVRLIAELLANGNAAELAATDANDISPLFTGGKSDWVHSIVTVCSPNNGTTLYNMAEELYIKDLIVASAFTYAGVLGRSPANGYVDFHLEQFGLTNIPGECVSEKTLREALDLALAQKCDNAAYDMSLEATAQFNKTAQMNDEIYYFSYPFSTTKQIDSIGTHVPVPSTLAILVPFATMIGAYKDGGSEECPVDASWMENDGLVSVVSASYPFGDAHTDYDPNNIQAGIWNVMPLSRGDHGNAIGIGTSQTETVQFYTEMLQMIETLPITD